MGTPSIEVCSVLVREPTTLLTDLVLSVACFWYAWAVWKRTDTQPLAGFWTLFFGAMAVSTLLGGLAHGFDYAFGKTARVASWMAAGVAVFCAEQATIPVVSGKRKKKMLGWLTWLQLALFVGAVLSFRTFTVVTVNTAVGLLGLVTAVHFHRYRKTLDTGSGYIVAGILLSGVTAIIHQFRISPHPWFNHNDLSHIILLFCLYLLMVGARSAAPLAEVRVSLPVQAGRERG